MTIESALTKLLACVAADNVDDVPDAIFDLGETFNELEQIPDDVTERLLMILIDEKMYESPLAGHILSFFEFEAPHLSHRAKSLCTEFLQAYGDKFKQVHSQQVVAELRRGSYLRCGP